MTNDTPGGEHSRLAQDFDLLVDAVKEAGALALTFFGKNIDTRRKGDGTPVSEADLAADSLLRERLMGARPAYGWLSEESVDDLRRLSLASVWVVDPIDGTRGFLDGRPEWTVVAALVENGQPVLAAIFNPVTEEMFTARRGAGAFLGDTRLNVEDATTIAGSRMIATKGLFRQKLWTEAWPEMHLMWANSIAYRLALIAAGRAQAAISLSGKSEWDLAAPSLLVEEAGGKVTAIDGSPFTFNNETTRLNGLVAAGRALHDLLIARTKLVAA